MYPLGPLFHGCGLNVTAMSLNGKLNVGVTSCPDLLPDLWRLVDDFNVALEELLDCWFRRAADALYSKFWPSARPGAGVTPATSAPMATRRSHLPHQHPKARHDAR